jgi:phosphate transport system ATP-binding protein
VSTMELERERVVETVGTLADARAQVKSSLPVKASVRHLSVYFGSQRALSDVSLDIRQGQVQALIGPSGCGKTTLLRSLNRMTELVPQSRHEGDVLLDGQSIYGPGVDVVDLRRRVGMVFQRPNPFPMSIFDNVTFGPRHHGVRNRRLLEEMAEESLRAAALWDEVKDKLHTSALALSGGQQQRLCIARALAVGPEVLLMDEPTSALDPISTAKVEELIRQLAGSYTVVLVTHSLPQAGRVADRVAFLLQGVLIEEGSAEDIFTRPRDRRTEDYISGRLA